MRSISTKNGPVAVSQDVVRAGMLSFKVPSHAHLLSGFQAWAQSASFPDRGHISFINGEIFIDMSPEELETHNKTKESIGRGIGNLNEEEDAGEFFTDGALVTNEQANLSTEPDGTFVKYATLLAGLVEYVPHKSVRGGFIEIKGRPDWILEVVSTFSVQKDTEILPRVYHKARIPEFWLVDARGPDILFQILVHRPRKYHPIAPQKGWHYSPVFDRLFRLTRRQNRVGNWQYKLESKNAAR